MTAAPTFPPFELPHFSADLVVLVHFAFVLFVILGALLVLRWPKLAYLHLPAALWGIWIEFSGRICPLTPLENALRRQAGEAGYSGGFIEHYILPVLYPSGLTRTTQVVLGLIVILVNLAIYGYLVLRHRPTQILS
ncbi:MAG TPA: DUF2784 domain-containing protein [Gemmatimonadales bacterium]|nr:DUF2784 domain-containing protein [Gemmatimonadales bacterium]